MPKAPSQKNNLNITLNVAHEKWKPRLKPYGKTVRGVLEAALAETELKNSNRELELAVVLADDAFVQELNKNYRAKDKPTNVLSFPSSELEELENLPDSEQVNLGDIILALETVEREAKEQGKTFRGHTIHLLVHGFLHLLGYNHIKQEEAEIMEAKEIKILHALGIENPYE